MDLNYIFEELNIYCLDYTFNQINEAIVRKKNLSCYFKIHAGQLLHLFYTKENYKNVRKSPGKKSGNLRK